MSHFDFDAVVKIGSMALLRPEDNDLDYNRFARLGADLRPGMILVTSGATEIGRIDYMRRNGSELRGDIEEIKSDYAAQGQSILMQLYRQYIPTQYSIRQVLVEHSHFNDPEKAEHIRRLLYRAANQSAIPIINYNDAVSSEENRKLEIMALKKENSDAHIVECVDNDETAAVITKLVGTEKMIILTSTEGIYRDPSDPSTLIETVVGTDADDINAKIDKMMRYCSGTSREGSGGAAAKLQYAKDALTLGTTVMIAHARHRLSDIIAGRVPCTVLRVEN